MIVKNGEWIVLLKNVEMGRIALIDYIYVYKEKAKIRCQMESADLARVRQLRTTDDILTAPLSEM